MHISTKSLLKSYNNAKKLASDSNHGIAGHILHLMQSTGLNITDIAIALYYKCNNQSKVIFGLEQQSKHYQQKVKEYEYENRDYV